MRELFDYSLSFRVYAFTLAALLGAVMGSFLLCMADRIVHKKPLGGRSVCDACGETLGVRDLIPVFSYLFHKGKCRRCGAKLSPLYPISELIGAVFFCVILAVFGISLQTAEYLILTSLLMAVSFADLEEYIIPDRFIVIGLIVRLVFLIAFERQSLVKCLIGAFALPLVLLLIVKVCEKVMHREAMGGGDIKLICLCGLILGWQVGILMLLFACVIGIVFGVIAIKNEKTDGGAFPWGPSIALATYICMLCGEKILAAYLGLFL